MELLFGVGTTVAGGLQLCTGEHRAGRPAVTSSRARATGLRNFGQVHQRGQRVHRHRARLASYQSRVVMLGLRDITSGRPWSPVGPITGECGIGASTTSAPARMNNITERGRAVRRDVRKASQLGRRRADASHVTLQCPPSSADHTTTERPVLLPHREYREALPGLRG